MKRSEIVLESLRACIRVSADLIRSLWMVLPLFAVIGCSESPFEPATDHSTVGICERAALMVDSEWDALCAGTEAGEEARRGRKRQDL